MKLVIAEKPSVAQSLAKVIGANQKKDGYIEGNGYIVSWCVGHLIELANPEYYDEKYKKWRKEDLPIFPAPFSYQVTASTKKQYQVLKELMKRSDVDGLQLMQDVRESLSFVLFISRQDVKSRLRDFGFHPWKIKQLKMALLI